jgi:AraC family transcriptional regulator
VRSPDDGWNGVSLRGYAYSGSDVVVPAMRDYLVVAYQQGRTPLSRRVDSGWTRELLGPGDVSVLTRAAESHWVWPADIEVVHVYLTAAELSATCRQMYERDVEDVELRDEVKADDPAIHHTAMLMAAEATHGGAGSQLLIDSLSSQLAVYILRRHAHVLFRAPEDNDGLSFAQERRVRDYVHEHLDQSIGLDDLAASVALSRFHFARRFRKSFGTSPHAFVLDQRVARAKALLTRTNTPLLDVAVRCGFADQSHLNRVFKGRVGTTPGTFRGAVQQR